MGGSALVAMVFAMSIGAVSLSASSILALLGEKLSGASASVSATERLVFWEIRLPRALLAFLVGGGLGMAGAAMQGWFRNPLADPGLLGISAGGALGAIAAIVLAQGTLLSLLGLWLLPICAFAGGLAAVLLVMRLATSRSGKTDPSTMLLAGIAVNAILGAGTGLLTYFADDQQLRSLTFWTMGSLSGAAWHGVWVAAAAIALATILLRGSGQALNLLSLGAEEAVCLGCNIDGLRNRIVAATALAAGATVALAGMIGFIGLVAPHLVRMAFGADHRLVLPGGFLLGGSLLVIADLIARTVVTPAEAPLGVITALLGAPFFLYLLTRQRRAQEALC